MKIYGSLFLWIPLTVFLIWLGIKELPDEVLQWIKVSLLVLFGIWNILAIIMFLTDRDARIECKKAINQPIVILGTLIFVPILIIPIITYYLNHKFTIKI